MATELTEPALPEPSVARLATDAAGPVQASPAPRAGENVPVDEPGTEEPDPPAFDLGRAAWLVTTLACLVAAVIVFLEGDYGYAEVALAVALAAAINLF